jgi:hypothetical protein
MLRRGMGGREVMGLRCAKGGWERGLRGWEGVLV